MVQTVEDGTDIGASVEDGTEVGASVEGGTEVGASVGASIERCTKVGASVIPWSCLGRGHDIIATRTSPYVLSAPP